MGDTKWADVAHYYTKSQIHLQIKNRDHAERFLMVSFRNVGGSHFEEWVNDGVYWRAYGSQFSAWADHQPILRHRDDITEAEAREIYCVAHGKDFKKKYGTTYFKGGYKSTLFEDQYESMDGGNEWELFVGTKPSVFHWLISHGFDVFGLIESGQAIRKEAGNGDS